MKSQRNFFVFEELMQSMPETETRVTFYSPGKGACRKNLFNYLTPKEI